MISASSSTDVTFEGNYESCPTCGLPSAVMDGSFSFDAEGRVTAAVAPQWSIDALRAVQGDLVRAMISAEWTAARATQARHAVEAARTKARTDPDGAIEDLARSNPSIAAVVERSARSRGWSKSDIIALLTLIVAALTLLQGQLRSRDGLDANDIELIVDRAIEGVAELVHGDDDEP